jgi:hypothetical protein
MQYTFIPIPTGQLKYVTGLLHNKSGIMVRNSDKVIGKIYEHADSVIIFPSLASINLDDYSQLAISGNATTPTV